MAAKAKQKQRSKEPIVEQLLGELRALNRSASEATVDGPETVDALLTIKGAHQHLKKAHGAIFSVSWLYREAGVTVPCVRPKPRMLRFRRSDLDRWMANLPTTGGRT